MGGEKKGVSIGPSTRSEVIRPNKGPSVWIERVEGTVGGGSSSADPQSGLCASARYRDPFRCSGVVYGLIWR